jgi:Mg2+ and Co2+ transporter CorA
MWNLNSPYVFWVITMMMLACSLIYSFFIDERRPE